MRIDILTLFPEMCRAVFSESILGRAICNGKIEVNAVNIRDFSKDKHNRVDDSPYGGGMGMLMQAQPIFDCFQSLCSLIGVRPHLIYMSPQGKVLTQQRAKELSALENIAILCGHYEGVDERVLEEIVDEEISIGDYVLTGGELPALVLTDCIARMVDGVLPNEEAFTDESHMGGTLEGKSFTMPSEWNGIKVPDVLLSGNDAAIEEYRRISSLVETWIKRPDMLDELDISESEWEKMLALRRTL